MSWEYSDGLYLGTMVRKTRQKEENYTQEEDERWLLRTKGPDSDEGGVAAGFSVLDFLLLIDVG